MKLPRTDNLGMRIAGSVMGLFFLGVGCASLVAVRMADPVAADADRVLWFGITAIVGGVLAIGFAWFEPRLDQVFCAPPKRWFGWRRTR